MKYIMSFKLIYSLFARYTLNQYGALFALFNIETKRRGTTIIIIIYSAQNKRFPLPRRMKMIS